VYRHLVADKQLAVMAAAGIFVLEQEGFCGCGALLSPLGGDLKKAQEALEKQLETLRTEPVTARELTKAKNQLLAAEVTQTLTVASKATVLGTAAVLEGDVSRVNRRLEQIRKVTADDLLRVAKIYLAPERSLTITVERNLLGTIFGVRSAEIKKEESAPITAKPETTPPPPGRPGLRRPADFAAQAPAAKVLDSRKPAAHTRENLPNGLKVIVVPNRDKPYVSIQLGLLAGAWTETKPGTASMALAMLTKGTSRHSEKELADELETYAIRLAGSSGLDMASLSAGCLSEHVGRAVDLMAEVVQTPSFLLAEFDKLRKQVRTSLALALADPSTKADKELRRRLFGRHPYARTPTGELEDVNALQVKDLSSWWTTFARPDQAVLIFAGDIVPAKAVELARSAFGGWRANGPRPEVALPPLPKAAPRRIYLVDHPGVQSQIRMSQLAIKRDHPDYATAEVVSDYFGDAFDSRLNGVIRVQRGLTYGARGGYRPSRFAGQFSLSTFSKTESTAETVQAVIKEFERLLQDPPTDKELADTKSYFVGSFARDRETPQQVAGNLWLLEYQGLPADYFERTLEKVARTDAASCMKLVKETLDPAQAVIVVVGSAARIQEGLEKIAPVTVVKPSRPADEEPGTAKRPSGTRTAVPRSQTGVENEIVR
jgi:zinc protease